MSVKPLISASLLLALTGQILTLLSTGSIPNIFQSTIDGEDFGPNGLAPRVQITADEAPNLATILKTGSCSVSSLTEALAVLVEVKYHLFQSPQNRIPIDGESHIEFDLGKLLLVPTLSSLQEGLEIVYDSISTIHDDILTDPSTIEQREAPQLPPNGLSSAAPAAAVVLSLPPLPFGASSTQLAPSADFSQDALLSPTLEPILRIANSLLTRPLGTSTPKTQAPSAGVLLQSASSETRFQQFDIVHIEGENPRNDSLSCREWPAVPGCRVHFQRVAQTHYGGMTLPHENCSWLLMVIRFLHTLEEVGFDFLKHEVFAQEGITKEMI